MSEPPAKSVPSTDDGWPAWMEEGWTASPPRPAAARRPIAPALAARPVPPKPAASKPASNVPPAAPTPAPAAAGPAIPRPASSACLPSVPAPPPPGTAERRAHVRFRPEGAIARFAKGGLLSKVGLGATQARVVNLSEGGVLLLGTMRCVEGTLIALRIELPSHQDAIAADARVRWCCESARHPGEHYVGLAFAGLKAGDDRKIATMREWFTSAEYKARSSTRLRRRPESPKA